MKRLILLATVAALGFGSTASADVISVDWLTTGDGALTRDTDQGLEFLDLTFTDGRSYNDVSAALETVGEFNGFEFATMDQVMTLFEHLVLQESGFDVTTSGTYGRGALYTEYGSAWAPAFVGLMGSLIPNVPWTGFHGKTRVETHDGREGAWQAYLYDYGTTLSPDGFHPWTVEYPLDEARDQVGSFLVRGAPGSSQENPILPEVGPGIREWIFRNAPSTRWFDPELVFGYAFEMLSGSLFTDILELPSFLTSPVTVSSGSTVYGQFGAGDSVSFGTGVSSFQVTGIIPGVDPGDPQAFPIKLGFNTETADFSMTALTGPNAVPEPGSFALLSIGAGMLGIGCWRRRRKHTLVSH